MSKKELLLKRFESLVVVDVVRVFRVFGLVISPGLVFVLRVDFDFFEHAVEVVVVLAVVVVVMTFLVVKVEVFFGLFKSMIVMFSHVAHVVVRGGSRKSRREQFFQ